VTPSRLQARILSNREKKKGVFLMELKAPGIARSARPGQFIMVRPPHGSDPLLPRPFSIHDARDGSVSILYRVVGRGTELLSGLGKGQALAVTGPLGRGFPIRAGNYRPALVAGGMGLAPMPFLAKKLAALGRVPKILYGCRTKGELLGPSTLGAVIATDDGSCGRRGLVTSLLEEELCRAGSCRVFACGPWAMLRQVSLLCQKSQVPCQVSLEARMACGLGACQGCAVRGVHGGYLSVCSDGPVFDSRLIDWEQEPPL